MLSPLIVDPPDIVCVDPDEPVVGGELPAFPIVLAMTTTTNTIATRKMTKARIGPLPASRGDTDVSSSSDML